MRRYENLQFIGPLSLIAALLGAEVSARALGEWPSSTVLWYLNLEVFRPFQSAIDNAGPMDWLGIEVVTPAIVASVTFVVLIGAGCIIQRRLLLAIASNFSLLCAALLYCGIVANEHGWMHSTSASVFAATVLLITLLSSIVSHRIYWQAIALQLHASRRLLSPNAGRFSASQRSI
jgi:hypothetical protein